MKTFKEHLTKNTNTLFHGGRGLEFNWRDSISHKKGRWEYGPGLYLTTHYDTAYKYAKGGGSIYLVTFTQGNAISDVQISSTDAFRFVEWYVVGSKKKTVKNDITSNMDRMKSDNIDAEHFLNIIINNDAIQNTKTSNLKQFLIEHGVDYSKQRYGGRDEYVYVIINPAIITKVEKIKASSVTQFELIPTF